VLVYPARLESANAVFGNNKKAETGHGSLSRRRF
jgi:hypothetical protein